MTNKKLSTVKKDEQKQLVGLLKEVSNELKAFRGNPKLKRPGEKLQFTKEQLEDLAKCIKDPVYFAEKFIKVVHVDKGLIPIELYPYQKNMIKEMKENRFVVTNACRQSGKSTATICFLLWVVLFHDDTTIALLANKGATARMLLGRIQLAYYNLPKWLQQGINTWNKGSIELENGSSILAAATSSDSVRGSSFKIVFCDEVAFIDNWETFFTSTYPTISSGKETKFFMVSTPNGMNHFASIWYDAVDGKSEFKPIEVNWWDVPGRDEQWKQTQIKNTSEEAFAQEHGLEFLGTSSTLINGPFLKLMRQFILTPLQTTKDTKIYSLPEEGRKYICTVDCADTGEDYSTVSVIDVTDYPFKQVATYKSNIISHLMFPQLIINLAVKYNNAEILVESNEVGKVILHILNYDFDYDHVISTKFTGKIQLGIRTTTKTKALGCARLKDMVESGHLIVQDDPTYQELMRFILKNSKTYQADIGYHDDMVMGLVIFAAYVNSKSYKMIEDENYSETFRKEKEEELYENLAGLPLFTRDLDAPENEDNSWLFH